MTYHVSRETKMLIHQMITPRVCALVILNSFVRLLPFIQLHTWGEVTSQNLWSVYDRHFVGITRYNVFS